MEIIANSTDHHKEYFYKISSNGRKNFYHRTANGHKRIAKAKIPPAFVDKIKPYNSDYGPDWLRSKRESLKKLEKNESDLKRCLDRYFDGTMSEKNYSKSAGVYMGRIKSLKNYIKHCEKNNKEQSEKRYQEETRKYGGFKNYFKQKYSSYNNQKYTVNANNTKYTILKGEGILEGPNEPNEPSNTYKDVRGRYRRWLVKNHPDKGGNNERCGEVIAEFKQFEESNSSKN